LFYKEGFKIYARYHQYLRGEVVVRFVDIDGIVYHHCSNFLFLNITTETYMKYNNTGYV
jgi:hypothetical protein